MNQKLLSIILTCFFICNLSAQDTDGEIWGYVTSANIAEFESGDVFAQGQDTVFVVKPNKVYRSIDAAETWDEYTTGVDEFFYDIHFQNNLIGYASGANGGLIKTTDGGSSWSPVALETTEDLTEIDISPNGAVWVVGTAGLLITSSDGVTWLETTIATENLNSIQFVSNTEAYVLGNAETFLHTSDSGVTWDTVSIDPDFDNNYVPGADLSNLKISNDTFYLFIGEIINDGNGYITNPGGMLISDDLINWNFISTGILDAPMPSNFDVYDEDIYMFAGGYMMCACCGLEIQKSTNNGVNWDGLLNDSLDWPFCNFIEGQLKISLYQDVAGYALAGTNLLQLGNDNATSTDNFKTVQFNLYPNPVVDDAFFVENLHGTSGFQVTIYNASGAKVQMFENVENKQSLDVSQLISGIYFVEITDVTGVLGTQKMLKR